MTEHEHHIAAEELLSRDLPIHEQWHVENGPWEPNEKLEKGELEIKLREAIDPYSKQFAELLRSINNTWITDEDEIANYQVAFDEALINAIKYGNSDAVTRTAEIEISMDEKFLMVSVKDTNPEPFDSEAAFNSVDNPENLLEDHGRGLVMMRAFFPDGVKYEFMNPGNKVTMTKLREQKV